MPRIEQPTSLFSNTRSAPLPNGIILTPSLPIGTDAAKGAGIGAGIYKDHDEAFASLKKLAVIDPDEANRSAYLEAYSAWKEEMKKL